MVPILSLLSVVVGTVSTPAVANGPVVAIVPGSTVFSAPAADGGCPSDATVYLEHVQGALADALSREGFRIPRELRKMNLVRDRRYWNALRQAGLADEEGDITGDELKRAAFDARYIHRHYPAVEYYLRVSVLQPTARERLGGGGAEYSSAVELSVYRDSANGNCRLAEYVGEAVLDGDWVTSSTRRRLRCLAAAEEAAYVALERVFGVMENRQECDR